MISIIAFIVVILGCMNWLSIGLFQYDIVAGLFGYQGSIFSRMVYIVVGVCACWLLFSVIKNKGQINARKLKHEERQIYSQEVKQEQALRNASDEQIEKAKELKQKDEQNQNAHLDQPIGTGRNHSNLQNL